jgi:uncharacterized membrane protein YesL
MRTRPVLGLLGQPAAFVLLSGWWAVCSCPVVTMPAATAAMFDVLRGWYRHGVDVNCSTPFLRAFRAGFGRATRVGFGWLLVGVPPVLAAYGLAVVRPPGSAALVVVDGLLLVLYAGASLYVGPLLVDTTAGLAAVAHNAVLLAVAKLPTTLAGLAVVAVFLVVATVAPITLFLLSSVAAYAVYALCHRALRRALRQRATPPTGEPAG